MEKKNLTKKLIVSILRLVSSGNTIFLVFEGACNQYSDLYCFTGHICFMSLLQQNLVWLICCYLFRFYILNSRDPTLKTFLFTAIIVYLPFLFHSLYWIYYYNQWSKTSEQHAPRLFSKPKDLVIAGSVVRQSSAVTCFILFLISIITLFVYIWIQWILVEFLREKTSRLSKTAMILNTQLVKTIHFQTLIPTFTIFGVATLIFMHYSVIDSIRIQNFPSMFLSSTLSIFPLSYIMFMPPYFNFCIGVPKKEVTRRIKEKLRIGNIIEIGHSTIAMYPLTTF